MKDVKMKYKARLGTGTSPGLGGILDFAVATETGHGILDFNPPVISERNLSLLLKSYIGFNGIGKKYQD